MFKDLKLRTKMFLGYSVPISLFILLAIPVLSSVNQVGAAFKQQNISMSAIEGGDDMAIALAKMARDLRGYLASNDESFLRDYENDKQIFLEKSEAVGKVIESSAQKERLQKMIALGNEYDTDFAAVIFNLLKQKKQAEAVKVLITRKGWEIVKKFDEVNREFDSKEHENLDTLRLKAESNLNFLVIAVGMGTFLGISCAIVAAYLISSGIAKKIAEAVAAIASSSNQIATTVEQQERTASQQAISVNETTTTMDELGASSRQSAEQAEAASVAARQALTLAEDGNQAVEQTLQGMSDLKDKVNAIAQEILHLSDQTNQIGNISSLVNDLANQTNMLALNAAVEAVRAGEHGKGFAVVATEIRKLADQSKKSTQQINHLVADIQRAVNSTVMVTDEGTKTVYEGMKIAAKTADSFAGVAEAVNNVVLNNQQISLNIKQQAIAIGQVVTAMNSLNQGATETAAGITQTKRGTQNLNEAAQKLKVVV